MHVFVDESKAGSYLLVASVMPPADIASARRIVRGALLPGQRRIHMKTESDARRRAILATLGRAGFTATIHRAGPNYKTDIARREACIESLVAGAVVYPDAKLTFECDESQDERDRRQLYRLVRKFGCDDRVQYEHRTAESEPLLAVPDAIGWAWAKGGDWRRRVADLVVAVVEV